MMMKTDWVIVAEICQTKQVDMSLITWPDKHRDQESVTKRAGVLKEAVRQGVRIGSLTTICPMSERNVRRAIGEELALKRQGREHCCP